LDRPVTALCGDLQRCDCDIPCGRGETSDLPAPLRLVTLANEFDERDVIEKKKKKQNHLDLIFSLE
jgi:hypothetical protein